MQDEWGYPTGGPGGRGDHRPGGPDPAGPAALEALHAARAELHDRLAVDRAIATASRAFIDHSSTDFDGCVDVALRNVAELTGADRGYVLRCSADGHSVDNTHEWCRSGVEARIEVLRGVPVTSLPWWPATDRAARTDCAELLAPLVVPRLADLPATTRPDVFDTREVRSLAVAPMVEQDRVVGFVGFDTVARELRSSPVLVSLLEQFAAVLTSAFGRERSEIARRRSETALRASEERFRRMVHNWPDAVLVIDGLGRISFANERIEEMLGFDTDEVLGVAVFDLLHPDDVERAATELAREVELGAGNKVDPVAFRARHRDGHWVPVEATANSLLDDASVAGVIVNVRDMSERERIAATLREAELRFRQAFEHAPIGMGVADLDGRLLRVNPALCSMLGFDEHELLGAGFTDLTHPDDRSRSLEMHGRLLGGELRDYAIEKRYRRRDSTWLWVRVSVSVVRDADGAPLYTIGQVEDVTERRHFEQRLTHEATHDALTGLPGRKLLLDRLEQALIAARRHDTRVGVLFIDLDHFKRVNDSLGHAAGDELLALVARRLQRAVRSADTPGRFGGDEFVVVCPDLAEARDVVVIAERIRAQLDRLVTVRGVDVHVGASIGIAVAEERTDAGTLLRQADDAAYRAKEKGRNRCEIFDEDLRASAAARLETETALRHALSEDGLHVAYQPLVEVATGRISGFEALVRWDRPGHGPTDPVEFLAVAEDSGLIVPLGRAVLRSAADQAAAWYRSYPHHSPSVSVNISAHQLRDSDLLDDVRGALRASGLPAHLLCLEITETTLMHDTIEVIGVLHELRELGVKLALDDFGTGYSSLSYLRVLPVDVVKIDRSFVLELGADREGSTIVAAVIDLAHALGMTIVAEGVETIEHVAALHNLGCDVMQGFYFSTPVAPEVATRMAREGVVPQADDAA